jgi:hypothetical protein
MESFVADLPKQIKLRGFEEMGHKHSYLTLKLMQVQVQTRQKLAFLLLLFL